MEQDQKSDILLQIEAFLFHFGEPVRFQKIADFFNISLSECKTAIRDLGDGLKEHTSPFSLLTDEATVQLVTKPAYQDISKKLMDGEFSDELSPASLEALSLIAYLGPISRPTLDFIRGVNSSFILRNLLMRGLIEKIPSAEKKHMHDYKVTFSFLQHMGISDVSSLQDYEIYRETLKKFEMRETEPVSVPEI